MFASMEQIDHDLRHGCLWIAVGKRYWRLRRNGRTQTWKRDLFRYRIPVKAGLYVYDAICNDTDIGTFDSNLRVIASETDPNTCPYRHAIQNAA